MTSNRTRVPFLPRIISTTLSSRISRPEHGTDAYEREAHVDAEILHVGFAQIFGMRVVRLGERIEKEFDLFVLVLFVDVAGEAIVPTSNQLRRWLNRMFA